MTATSTLVLLGGWATRLAWQRFFLFRHQAAMLFLFSGSSPSQASREAERFFPTYSSWAGLNRRLRQALIASHRNDLGSPAATTSPPGFLDRLAGAAFSRSILALAFSRGGTDIALSTREALALYFRLGPESRLLARRWLWLSAAGLAFLFLCLALPNWFFFTGAGAPVWIGMALAAAIAWLLHRAFVVHFVLAGISSTLLAATRGRTPDPDLLEKLAPFVPPSTSPDGLTK